MRKLKWENGFTLMELLIVITIMAVLVSLIFPAFSRVQRFGRNVRSSNNLRQLHTAAMNYNVDKGSIPHSSDSYTYLEYDPIDGGQTNQNGWVSSHPDPLGHAWWYEKDGWKGTWSVTNGALFKYLGDEGDQSVYICPAMARAAKKASGLTDEQRVVTRSYGMNQRLSGANIIGYSGASRTFLFATQGLLDMGGGRNYLSAADDGPDSGSKPPPGDPFWGDDYEYDKPSYHVTYNLGVNGRIDCYWDDSANERVWTEYIGAYHGSNPNEAGLGRGLAVFVDGHVESVMYEHTDYIGNGDWENKAPMIP